MNYFYFLACALLAATCLQSEPYYNKPLTSILNQDLQNAENREETFYTREAVQAETKGKEQLKKTKKKYKITRGDGKVYFGGRVREDYYFYKNAVLLNKDLPDEYGFFKTTFDFSPYLIWGKKHFEHNALEIFATMRHKSEWGVPGRTTGTFSSPVFTDRILVGNHSHGSTKPLMWLKDCWLKLSLNAVCDVQGSSYLQFIKIGYFPFSLGRGIALGQGYGTPKDFLGIYNRANDFSAPGILITGEIVEDMLWYDLYYAKFEDNSAALGQTLNHSRENHLGRQTRPWTGVGKDDELFAMQLRYQPFSGKRTGTLEIKPYILYNDASNKKVEFVGDSKSELGTVGLDIEYAHPCWEAGAEAAFNFGQEKLYSIDRNIARITQTTIPGNIAAYLGEEFSHVVISGSTNKAPCLPGVRDEAARSARIAACKKQEFVGKPITVPGSSETFAVQSSPNRFRPAYENYYRGYMVVADLAYKIPACSLKVAGAFGYASGDRNPHIEECDKRYRGFLGLNELYSGKQVKSIFMLEERVLRRPLTFVETAPDSGSLYDPIDDASFTDLVHAGVTIAWSPLIAEKRMGLQTNCVFFWKEHASFKWDSRESKPLPNQQASKYLGTELNLLFTFEILRDLLFSANGAVFLPGSYYSDIKGAPLKDDFFKTLDLADLAQIPSPNTYRISDDTAYFINVGMEYRF